MRLPKGYPNPDKPGYTKIAVSLRNKTFQKVLKQAKRDKKYFSEMVEDIILCGLLCLEESDANEINDMLTSAHSSGGNGSAEGSTSSSEEPNEPVY